MILKYMRSTLKPVQWLWHKIPPVWAQCAILFCAQCINYGLLCWNYRSVAKALIAQTVVSDLILAALSFKVLKKIQAADSNLAWLGYTLGGATGSAISLQLTKMIWGN